MVKKIIDIVTITGIDDNVDFSILKEYSYKYPWVEWGILVSKSKNGMLRYPSFLWINKLLELGLNLSAHICGKFLRDICNGDWNIFDILDISKCNRIQLNLSNMIDDIDRFKFIDGLKNIKFSKQIILQSRDINHPLIIASSRKRDILPLYDISGGKGIKPIEWPVYFSLNGCGFSGGLTSENIKEELDKISFHFPGFVWIDIESGVRTYDKFDFKKVDKFLENVLPWVKK